jgi:hypothetical protein
VGMDFYHPGQRIRRSRCLLGKFTVVLIESNLDRLRKFQPRFAIIFIAA